MLKNTENFLELKNIVNESQQYLLLLSTGSEDNWILIHFGNIISLIDVATNATSEEEESNQSAEDEDSIESAGDGEESIESAESVEGAEENKKSYTLLG